MASERRSEQDLTGSLGQEPLQKEINQTSLPDERAGERFCPAGQINLSNNRRFAPYDRHRTKQSDVEEIQT